MPVAARRAPYDLRGVLALFTIGSVFVYSFVLLVASGAEAQMPPWMVAVASMVVGHYFGARENGAKLDAYEAVIYDLRNRLIDEEVHAA